MSGPPHAASGAAQAPRGLQSSIVGLWVALLAAAVARAILLPQADYPTADGTWWLALARDLAAFGRFGSSEIAPGYPASLASVLVLVGWEHPMAPLRAAQGINLAAGFAQAGLAFFLVRHHLSARGALAAAVLILALPLTTRSALGDGFELLAGCLYLGGWLAVERSRPVLAGVLLGAASLVGLGGLLLLVAAPLLSSQWGTRERLRCCASALAVILAFVVLGALSGSGVERGLWGAWTHYLGSGARGWLDWMTRWGAMLPRQLGWPLVALAVVGAVAYGGRWLVLLVPMLALPFSPYSPEPRAWVSFLPALLLAALYGLRLVRVTTFERGWGRWATGVAIALTLMGLAWSSSPLYPRVFAHDPFQPGLKEAGLWMRSRVTRRSLITAPLPYAAYWAWCRHMPFPQATGATVGVDRAIHFGAEILVVDAGVAATRYPELLPLVGQVPPHLGTKLEPLQSFGSEEEPDQAVYLYTLLRP